MNDFKLQKNLCCSHKPCVEDAIAAAKRGRILKLVYEVNSLDDHDSKADNSSEGVELGLDALDLDALLQQHDQPRSGFRQSFAEAWNRVSGMKIFSGV